MDLRRLLDPRIALAVALLAAAGLLVLISLEDSIRMAGLVAAIGALAVATRVRYSPLAALALLALMAVVALTGNGPATSERPSHKPATAAHGER
jgi:hypothetical protein